MLKTVVVDDELPSLERIKGFINKARELELVADYRDAATCLQEIKENKVDPDVIFLDIEILGHQGLELAERILRINQQVDIVFVTAYDSYAVEAFELNALDYLLKPVNEERFQKTIFRLLSNN